MCGIAGIFVKNTQGSNWLSYLPNATSALSRRGPDAQHVFTDETVSLGHCRLTIIDLTEAADQPMFDTSKRYCIVYNGEIFNYLMLREQLETVDEPFHTQSDTEVILRLYSKYGTDMLPMLNGYFAFAIYDTLKKTCFIARDRFGEKPVYYYEDENCLLFASEIKALLRFPIKKEMDPVALQEFLQLNYIAAPHSIYPSIKKLLPGHFILCSSEKTMLQSWYTIPVVTTRQSSKKDYGTQQQKLFQLLDEAVQLRLVSDVPLGSFLSGGLDSSIISGLASKHLEHLPTFSLGFKDDHFFDETKDAIAVAKHFNTEHTAFTLSRNDLYEALFEVLDYLDEPFGDSSALPFYILSKLTRQKVKVALSGDGADEVFGGYVKHNGEFRARNPGLPELAVSAMQPLLNLFPASRNNQFMNSLRRLQRFAEGMKLDEQARYWKWCTIATANEAMELLLNKPPVQEFLNRKKELTSFIQKRGDLNEVLLNDMHLVLPNDMLHKADAMSMANGLEVRSPFLDYRVVAFAFSLPAAYKVDSHHRKMIVHDAFRKLLPASLYHRPKHGFEIPLHGFLTTELRSLIVRYLGNDFIQEQKLFSYSAITLLKQQLFSSNPGDSAARVWGLIVFQHWWNRNLAGQSKTMQASMHNQ